MSDASGQSARESRRYVFEFAICGILLSSLFKEFNAYELFGFYDILKKRGVQLCKRCEISCMLLLMEYY